MEESFGQKTKLLTPDQDLGSQTLGIHAASMPTNLNILLFTQSFIAVNILFGL